MFWHALNFVSNQKKNRYADTEITIIDFSDTSLFPKLEEVSIDTAGGKVDRFKYGCHLKVDGNPIEVEVVPKHKSLIGRDVLRYFRMGWDRWFHFSYWNC